MFHSGYKCRHDKPHGGKTAQRKKLIPPGSKTVTVQLLKNNSTGARNCNCIRKLTSQNKKNNCLYFRWKGNLWELYSSNARQLGCVFQDMTPPKSILRKSTDMPKPIQRVKLTKAIARHIKNRDQNPSLGYICPGEPHERSPNAPNFEDRSQKERVARATCPRSRKEQHSSHFRKIGACLRQLLNLRKENLLSTPERQCT